jgi:hypothetical protein
VSLEKVAPMTEGSNVHQVIASATGPRSKTIYLPPVIEGTSTGPFEANLWIPYRMKRSDMPPALRCPEMRIACKSERLRLLIHGHIGHKHNAFLIEQECPFTHIPCPLFHKPFDAVRAPGLGIKTISSPRHNTSSKNTFKPLRMMYRQRISSTRLPVGY